MQPCPNCQRLNDEKDRMYHFRCECGCEYDLVGKKIKIHPAWPVVKEWNDTYPIGQDVVVKLDFQKKGTVTKTRSMCRIMGDESVIWLEGITGCYALSHVIPI